MGARRKTTKPVHLKAVVAAPPLKRKATKSAAAIPIPTPRKRNRPSGRRAPTGLPIGRKKGGVHVSDDEVFGYLMKFTKCRELEAKHATSHCTIFRAGQKLVNRLAADFPALLDEGIIVEVRES